MKDMGWAPFMVKQSQASGHSGHKTLSQLAVAGKLAIIDSILGGYDAGNSSFA